ncbi:fimbrial protein [Lysobacter arenosi]|uniref:Fimbrial protein n=1 Tax=Lysobacter arenosi TaxID=2795387 RepID=A0ABX7RA43_9GAMM|nr:fimbrial protein [Lysobacter arenosi]QSX74368.1 fimbrial protein [Lysobacter arenosi]
MTNPCNRRLRACFVALCLAMVSQGAAAISCSAPLPITVNIPSVSVPSSLPIGQAIPGALASYAIPVNCINGPPAAGSRWYLTNNGGQGGFNLYPGFTDVYTWGGMSGGLGFRLRDASGNILAPIDYQYSRSTFNLGPASAGANTLQGSFELVKAASIVAQGSGTLPTSAHIPNQAWANGGSAGNSTIRLQYTILPTPVASCSVTQSNISVALGTVSGSLLPSIGATSNAAPFNISLNCESGSNVRISMTDATLPSNESTTLTLSAASTALGVGVQMLYAGALVKYGPAPNSYTTSSVPSTNSISLGVQSGAVQIPFQARFVRTGSTVGAGTVQALSTFTLSYQ